MRHQLAASLLTLSWAAAPQLACASADMRPAFFAFVSKACIHQDTTYRSSVYGKRLETSKDFAGWDSFSATPAARCQRAQRWVPEALCASAAGIDITQRAQLNDWFDAHRTEAIALAPVFRFVNSAEAAAGECPEIRLGE